MDVENLKKQLKTLPWKKYLYPLASSVVLIATLLMFLSAVRFISGNFNKIFSISQSDIESRMTKLDQINLSAAAKKLNIVITAQTPPPPLAETPVQPEPEPILGPPILAPTPDPAPAPKEEVKSELKVQVLNSTKTSGLAGTLKTDLEKAGFIATTGNTSPVAATTIVQIKASKKTDFPKSYDEIKQIVDAKYEIIEQVLDEANASDVVITIGSK